MTSGLLGEQHPPRDVLNSVGTIPGALSVMTCGETLMPLLFAGSLAILRLVSNAAIYRLVLQLQDIFIQTLMRSLLYVQYIMP